MHRMGRPKEVIAFLKLWTVVMDCCLGWLNLVQAGFGQCTGNSSVHRGGVITLATVHAVHAVQQSFLQQRSVYGRYHYHAII